MATTAGDKVFVDTNILVYARSVSSPFHRVAVTRLDDLEDTGAELWISRQTIREYLATLTKPGATTPPISLPDLIVDVQGFQSRFQIAEDGPSVTTRLEILLMAIYCGGRQIHDANIVATMLAHGIPTLLTHNVADFQRFAGHVTVAPLVP
jgi:predicted nucleic acid-binding protein